MSRTRDPQILAQDPVDSHVVFLHSEFKHEQSDLYLINAMKALQRFGHKTTVITSSKLDENSLPYTNSSFKENVQFSGSWLPNSIFNKFENLMVKVKAVWMALMFVVFPPKPKSKVVILDIDPIALFPLYWCSNYTLIYICNLESILLNSYIPDCITNNAMDRADEIIVQSKYLQKIFFTSLPNVERLPYVLHPCINKGFLLYYNIEMKSILPNIPEGYRFFVTFGDYTESSNFKFVIDAFDTVNNGFKRNLNQELRLVIAGNLDEASDEHNRYYSNLVEYANTKICALNVFFLRKVSIPEKKLLIEKSTSVIHPSIQYVYSEIILVALSLGRIVVATDEGYAKEVLTNGYTGFLLSLSVDKFSALMCKILETAILRTFVTGRAKEAFDSFSFTKFSENLNKIVMKHVDER